MASGAAPRPSRGPLPRRLLLTALPLVLAFCVGLLVLGTGLHPRPGTVQCPGEVISGRDGEETPGPMRPGDTCALWDHGRHGGMRSYGQQRAIQLRDARRLAWIGGAVCGVVLLGSCALVVRHRRRRTPADT
ncbi:hypothetical protein [Streptomyces sp. NPDC050560]|uniref:hypothetical protein n=1 Tax=Streptomyces sp. NPDC050560 TaxID=3365630 RepID=UPI003796C1D2